MLLLRLHSHISQFAPINKVSLFGFIRYLVYDRAASIVACVLTCTSNPCPGDSAQLLSKSCMSLPWLPTSDLALLQDFGGEAAYAPFHEPAFRQHLAQSSHQELTLMQQMLDWRESEIHNELILLDGADDRSQGRVHSYRKDCTC